MNIFLKIGRFKESEILNEKTKIMIQSWGKNPWCDVVGHQPIWLEWQDARVFDP